MRACLALAAFAGLRACEIAGLDWHDVDFETGQLRIVEGKGGHSRVLPLSTALAAELERLYHAAGR